MVSKQKILIVDDDNNIAELIALYLTKECFETKIVNDGEEALREFASFRPDLIILDLMLPGIDGYQVCREIRHLHSRSLLRSIRWHFATHRQLPTHVQIQVGMFTILGRLTR